MFRGRVARKNITPREDVLHCLEVQGNSIADRYRYIHKSSRCLYRGSLVRTADLRLLLLVEQINHGVPDKKYLNSWAIWQMARELEHEIDNDYIQRDLGEAVTIFKSFLYMGVTRADQEFSRGITLLLAFHYCLRLFRHFRYVFNVP